MNEASGYITLNRDCEGVEIPQGNRTMLPKGTQVRIGQSLGGSYTVITGHGEMVRISGEDADALGKEKTLSPPTSGTQEEASLEKLVWDQLKTCYDPEIPINIVELGLIYECKLAPLENQPEITDVSVKMTLTAPGCGMGEVLKRDVESKIARLPGVKHVSVELVWEPPWDQSKMSDAAKLKLGML